MLSVDVLPPLMRGAAVVLFARVLVRGPRCHHETIVLAVGAGEGGVRPRCRSC